MECGLSTCRGGVTVPAVVRASLLPPNGWLSSVQRERGTWGGEHAHDRPALASPPDQPACRYIEVCTEHLYGWAAAQVAVGTTPSLEIR